MSNLDLPGYIARMLYSEMPAVLSCGMDIWSLLLGESGLFTWVCLLMTRWRTQLSPSCYTWTVKTRTKISVFTFTVRVVLSPLDLAIYDTMKLIRPKVSTICVGLAASMATVLLCAGAKGKRYSLPNATIHMHQAAGGAQGQASDIAIAAREIMRVQDIIRSILAKHTGQPLDKIAHDTDRDYYLNPQQAVEYGIIDEVLIGPEEKEARKITRKILNRRVSNFTATRYRKDGKPVSVSISASPVVYKDFLIGAVAVYKDISELVQRISSWPIRISCCVPSATSTR